MENLEPWVPSYGYAAIFAGMLAEQSPLPLPGEPLLLAAGALAGTGYLAWPLALGVALAGTVVGDVLWYEIGRKGGPRVPRWLCRFSLEPDSCVRGSQDTFARHGAAALLIAKFLPGLSTVAQRLAGVGHAAEALFSRSLGSGGCSWDSTPGSVTSSMTGWRGR